MGTAAADLAVDEGSLEPVAMLTLAESSIGRPSLAVLDTNSAFTTLPV